MLQVVEIERRNLRRIARQRLAKQGGLGYEAPTSRTFPLVDDFIAAGFDVLNPIQCSAARMNPYDLKSRFGNRISFWGGGVDTQAPLPFGSPQEVREEVRERIRAFGPGGGFVFNAVHNIQALVSAENVLAMYRTAREFGRYPLRLDNAA